MRPLVFVACLAAAASCSGTLRPPVGPSERVDDKVWDRLKQALAGSWSMQTPSGSEFSVVYKVISNGTALVEMWGLGSTHETETVFYPDHRDILLTHFCAQGNQPRLRAVRVSKDEIEFRFVDVTNRSSEQAMLVLRRLHFAGDVFLDTEIYRQVDGTNETTTYRLVRKGS